MKNFDFISPTRIIFGKGVEKQTGEITAQYTDKVLLVYGGGSVKKYGLYDTVVNGLNKAGVEYFELAGVEPNPRLSLVHKGIDICRKEGIGFILAVGGGSVIDTSKAIAAGVLYDGDVWDFFIPRQIMPKALPVGVVLTIPAAGSEASDSVVITKVDEDGWRKMGSGGDAVRPVFAIMNPELTYTLPPYQTAAGATDMFLHVLERYFTNPKNVELTDRLCESIMKTVVNNAGKVLANPTDYDARAEIMWCGTLAHNGLVGTGREPDFASHGIEHELSALYDVTHGAGLAVICPAWMKYVYKHDIPRFAQFANRVFDIEIDPFDLETTALKGIAAFEGWLRSIGMPTTAEELGVDESKFEYMASCATANDTRKVGNFVPLDKDGVFSIFMLTRANG